MAVVYDERGRAVIDVLSEHGRMLFSGRWLEDGALTLAQTPFVTQINVYDEIVTLEVLTGFEVSPLVDASDDVAVGEFYDFYFDVLVPNVFDGVTVAEDYGYAVGNAVDVYDGVTVAESFEYAPYEFQLEVFDIIAVSDFGEVLDLIVEVGIVTEVVLLSDSVGISLDVLNVEASDDVAVAEWVDAVGNLLDLEVHDGVWVGEWTYQYQLSPVVVNDSVFTDEFTVLSLDILYVRSVEDISVSEWNGQFLDVLNIDYSDDIAVSEDIALEVIMFFSVFDDIVIAEEHTEFDMFDMDDNIVENIAVTESASLFIFAVPIRMRPLNPQVRYVDLKPIRRQIKLYPREGVTVS